jgi:glutathione S-transferase
MPEERRLIELYGINLSTFTRKVRLALAEKGLDYRLEVAPMGSPRVKALNPLGKIPVLVDGEIVVPDSSVIVAYLERAYPARPLWPAGAAALAEALWLEEFADTSLREATLPWFAENVVKPLFQAVPGDPGALNAAAKLRDRAFGYLEQVLTGPAPTAGEGLTVAHVAIGAQLVTYRQGEGELDPGQWPNLSRWYPALSTRPAWAGILAEEQAALAAARNRLSSRR